ncbi:MAG: hypothetical protein Q9M91_03860, partial [Candidatus Dojkabacteria bacterium]|nr:hypothetical protein [Candidatus Dojkabacteria bacterium]
MLTDSNQDYLTTGVNLIQEHVDATLEDFDVSVFNPETGLPDTILSNLFTRLRENPPYLPITYYTDETNQNYKRYAIGVNKVI